MRLLTSTGLALAVTTPCVAAPLTAPEIWSHRGASYLSYENTNEAFALGETLGATGYELDLVLTKDGQLAVFHDLTLNDLTNVETVFSTDRARMETDETGATQFVYYVEDFTMAELKTLELDKDSDPTGRNIHVRDDRNPHRVADDYVYRIPTYGESLDLLNDVPGQKVLTEVKLDGDGTAADRDAIQAILLQEWTDRGIGGADSPIVVQSFSEVFMDQIDAAIENAGLQVPTYQLAFDLQAPGIFAGLTPVPESQEAFEARIAAEYGNFDGIATFFHAFDVEGAGFFSVLNPFGLDLKAALDKAGLGLYVWTLSVPPSVDSDGYFAWLNGTAPNIDWGAQYGELLALGVDGIITDTPDIARAVIDERHLAPVPLPASLALFGAALFGLGLLRRKA